VLFIVRLCHCKLVTIFVFDVSSIVDIIDCVVFRQGPFPIQFWHWSQIEYNMRLCLSGLKDVDRYVSNTCADVSCVLTNLGVLKIDSWSSETSRDLCSLGLDVRYQSFGLCLGLINSTFFSQT